MSDAHTILRNYRLDQGLSQVEFAEILKIPPNTLRSLENGWRPITPERAKKIEQRTEGSLTRVQLRPDIFEAA